MMTRMKVEFRKDHRAHVLNLTFAAAALAITIVCIIRRQPVVSSVFCCLFSVLLLVGFVRTLLSPYIRITDREVVIFPFLSPLAAFRRNAETIPLETINRVWIPDERRIQLAWIRREMGVSTILVLRARPTDRTPMIEAFQDLQKDIASRGAPEDATP